MKRIILYLFIKTPNKSRQYYAVGDSFPVQPPGSLSPSILFPGSGRTDISDVVSNKTASYPTPSGGAVVHRV